MQNRLGMFVRVARDSDGAQGVLMQVGTGEEAVYRFLTPQDARLVATALVTAAVIIERQN